LTNAFTPATPLADHQRQARRAVSVLDCGEHDGKTVRVFTLTNRDGLTAKITNYGAILTELHVPDRNGAFEDVALGCDDVKHYRKADSYFGATVGRVANRIRDARFELDGKTYELDANDGPRHLHGGRRGWDRVMWDAKPLESREGPGILLHYTCRGTESGYPGDVLARVTYTLTNDNAFRVQMQATTDETTLINMAHHSYWNLAGHDAGSIEGHELELRARQYTPSKNLLPTGSVVPVAGTPFDFTRATPIGTDLHRVENDPLGYDHNWVVDGAPNTLRPVARVRHPGTGRVMELEGDQPGVQFYSGNFLNGTVRGKGGVHYRRYGGFCLETQKFPDAINIPAWRNQVIVRAGSSYEHTMIHRFSVD
jgi:aldose 1-epimerase